LHRRLQALMQLAQQARLGAKAVQAIAGVEAMLADVVGVVALFGGDSIGLLLCWSLNS